jgi:hypothetical protein
MNKSIVGFFLLLIIAGYAPTQNWISYTAEGSGLVSNDVRAVAIDPFGKKWFATAEGLSRFDGSEWQTFTTDDDLISNDIRALAFEKAGDDLNLWLATAGGVTEMGISDDAATVKRSITSAETPLVSNDVTAILADKHGIKWFGTSEGFSSFDGTNWSTFLAADSFFIIDDNITCAFSLQDAAPVVMAGKHTQSIIKNSYTYDLTKLNFFGSKGGGANRIIVNGVDAITTGSPVDATWGSIVSDHVNAVFVDSRMDQWFGTDNGVCLFVGDEIRERTDWTNFTTDSVHTAYKVFKWGIWVDVDTSYAINGDGLADLFIEAICEDMEDGLWFGTRGGLTRYSGAAWWSFITEDGLVHNNVTDVACDSDGSLWITTKGGVSHLVQTAVAVEAEPIPSNYILHLENYPNPFNMKTTITYTLPVSSDVNLSIYNIVGQKIRFFEMSNKSAGQHQLVWDGRNNIQQDVPSGIYLVRLSTANSTISHKMMVVK